MNFAKTTASMTCLFLVASQLLTSGCKANRTFVNRNPLHPEPGVGYIDFVGPEQSRLYQVSEKGEKRIGSFGDPNSNHGVLYDPYLRIARPPGEYRFRVKNNTLQKDISPSATFMVPVEAGMVTKVISSRHTTASKTEGGPTIEFAPVGKAFYSPTGPTFRKTSKFSTVFTGYVTNQISAPAPFRQKRTIHSFGYNVEVVAMGSSKSETLAQLEKLKAQIISDTGDVVVSKVGPAGIVNLYGEHVPSCVTVEFYFKDGKLNQMRY